MKVNTYCSSLISFPVAPGMPEQTNGFAHKQITTAVGTFVVPRWALSIFMPIFSTPAALARLYGGLCC